MSYNFLYNLIGIKEEVNRLQRQAKLGWDKEFRTLKWLGLRDGMKVLDVGAGPGFISELLLENLPNIQVTALEIDNKLLDVAKQRLVRFQPYRINYAESSIMNTHLESNQYDFVIARFVFQHLDDPIKAAREIFRLLKPGGIVAIIDSDRELSGISEPEYLLNKNNSILKTIEKSARWNREIGRNLLKILRASGFSDLDFEAVTIHSDIVGIENIIGNMGLDNEELMEVMRKNPRFAKMVRASRDRMLAQNGTVILLNLIAKGVKKT